MADEDIMEFVKNQLILPVKVAISTTLTKAILLKRETIQYKRKI